MRKDHFTTAQRKLKEAREAKEAKAARAKSQEG